MAKKKIGDIVAEELEAFLREEGLELFRTEFVKEGKDWFLRVFIEGAWTEGGPAPRYVTTDDCEKVSRYISGRLDELDPIPQAYYLEVSSPGLDRPLLTERDFRRFTGSRVEGSLYQSLDGKKSFQGELLGLDEGNILVRNEKGEVQTFPMEKVSKTKLAVTF